MGSFYFNRAGIHKVSLPPALRKVPVSLGLASMLMLLVAASFVFCLYISRQPVFINLQMNSDNLLAVSYIWDLQHHDYALSGFQLPRIPSILPDLAIQFAAVAVSPSYRWSLFVYAWIQIVLFVLAAAYVAALLAARPLYQAIAPGAVLIGGLVLVDASLPWRTGITLNYFLACIHFGPFVASLMASAIAWRLLQDWRHSWAALLFGVSTLSILSNKLLLVAFAIPVGLAAVTSAAVLMPERVTKAYRIVALVAASALLAHVLDKGINRQPDIPIEWRQAPARLQSFLVESVAFVGDHIWVVILCVFAPMAVFVTYPLFSIRNVRALFGRRKWSETDLAKAFFWLQGACALTAVFTAVALLAYADYGSYRYLAPVMTWPIIFTIAAVLASSLARRATYAMGAGILALCVADMVGRGDAIPGTVSWRSPVADCIISNIQRFNLKAGIAEYWISRPVMFGSNWSLQVNQSTGDGHPYIWGNNQYWYIKAFDSPHSLPTYNFVVMERMDPTGVKNRFGDPTHRIECPTGQQIWVYGDGKRMTERFLEPLIPPYGSYQQSCTDVMRVGFRISGKCRQPDGTWKWTRIK